MAELVVALVAAVAGAVLGRLLSRSKERREATIELFRRYHEPEMLSARNVAWRYLKVDYDADGRAFHELFSDKNEMGTSHYNQLVQVIYFWHLLLCLHRERMLDDDLAREFFEYQWSHWSGALEPLHAATVRHEGSDRPEWTDLLVPGAMSWLDRREPQVPAKPS